MKIIISLFSLVLLISSCEYNNVQPSINESDVVGPWWIESVTFNGDDSKLFNGWEESNYLKLDEDKVAARGYAIGTWSVNHRTLVLAWNWGPDFTAKETARIVSVSSTQFVIETEVDTKDYESLSDFRAKFGHLEQVTKRTTYKIWQ